MLKVFIVDNSTPIVVRLMNILSEIDDLKIVGVANSISNTLNLILNSEPDVLILETHMPDGSGFEILKKIKKIRPEVTVLMITNHSDYKSLCLKEGANYFIDKSIEFEKIIDICKKLVNKKINNSNKLNKNRK